MTCQYCQTWVLDEGHRCRRCGRRVKSTSARISAQTYPVAATATAPGYEYEMEPVETRSDTETVADSLPRHGQQPLFSAPPSDSRVIPFDSLNPQAAQHLVRARAA